MRLFVRTLTRPALMWYANQDTWKWFYWVDMAKDFITQYRPPNRESKGCDLLKRKSIESLEGIKGNESQKKIAESTLGHYCSNEVQSKDKGKTIVTKASNVPPLVPDARKTQTFTPLSMLGHTTDECQCLKEEIQKLLDSGIIIQRRVAHPKLVGHQLSAVTPMSRHNRAIYPQSIKFLSQSSNYWIKDYCTKSTLSCIFCAHL
ncbi:hypothetical protein KY284_012690 [Solanum tuberosum]|nr:hypothetical protein KY284_012690 [Solanum tuberosum]